MKNRIYLLILVNLLVLGKLSAQTGWSSNEHKGDELKGTESYYSYKFEDSEENDFIYWSNSDYNFRIISGSHIFDYSSSKMISITVGFYSIDDNLIDKGTTTLVVSSENSHFAEVPGKKIGRKVLKYLNENEGYVRIIAPLYGTLASFDIKIPCMKKELIGE